MVHFCRFGTFLFFLFVFSFSPFSFLKNFFSFFPFLSFFPFFLSTIFSFSFLGCLFLLASVASRLLVTFHEKISRFGRYNTPWRPLFSPFSFDFFCSCSFSFSDLHSVALIVIMVVTSWLSVGYHLVISDDQVESRVWWVAGGSRHTFVSESPDECARAVAGVKTQSGLFYLS